MQEALGFQVVNQRHHGLPIAAIRVEEDDRLVVPAKSDGRAFLAYQNYDNILKWNRSNYFAIAVGTLADDIAYR